MIRYKLRTLLILLVIGPPILAVGHWGWRESQERRAAEAQRQAVFNFYFGATR